MKLSGREFEKLIDSACEVYKKRGSAHISHYGVKATRAPSGDGGFAWRPMKSLPDYEGVLSGGQQFIFDAKVCTQASFSLTKYVIHVKDGKKKRGARRKQLEHMLDRSRYGVECGFLIHWNPREMKTKSVGPATYWLPVQDNSYWRSVERGALKSISRSDCRMLGKSVQWGPLAGSSKVGPGLLEVLRELQHAKSH